MCVSACVQGSREEEDQQKKKQENTGQCGTHCDGVRYGVDVEIY